MTEAPRSTVRLRKIGRELRQLREESGYTLVTAGRHLERSASSLSKIETGMQWLRLRDLGHILDAYGVSPALRAAIMTLAEQDRQCGWWHTYKDLLTSEAIDRVSLEHDAKYIAAAETNFVPGLLQTEDYARAVITGVVPQLSPHVAERYVAFRLARQGILYQPEPPRLEVILDEAALRRMRGGRGVMRSQLRRLLNQSELDHVLLQVMPLAIDAGPEYTGGFQLITLGSPPVLTVVLTEHLTGQWIIESEAETTSYRSTFERHRSCALTESASRDFIHGILSEL